MGTLAGHRGIRTFKLLGQIADLMGTTKTTIFPLLESAEDESRAYRESAHALTAESGGPGFDAYPHMGGVNSYLFDASYNMYLKGPDHADFTFGDGTNDAAFSVGLWVLPFDIASVTLMAKYDTNSKREWKLEIDSSGDIEFEIFDEADKSEIGTSATGMTADIWTFVAATYDGTETAPVVGFYQNGVADATTTTTEANAYVAMDDTASPLTIGAHLATGVPTQPFDGRIAMPFVTGKALSAAEIMILYNITKNLMGL